MADNFHSAFRVVSGEPTPAYGKNGELLGSLAATLVYARSGETQFGVLKVKDDPRPMLVPVPWAIMQHYRCGERCVADVDRRKLVMAPHCTQDEIGHFDTDLAARIDGAYGLEFPGIESLNDLA